MNPNDPVDKMMLWTIAYFITLHSKSIRSKELADEALAAIEAKADELGLPK